MWNSSRQAGEIGENTGKDRETPGKSGEPHFPPLFGITPLFCAMCCPGFRTLGRLTKKDNHKNKYKERQ